MTPLMEWKEACGQYVQGSRAYRNRVELFYCFWQTCREDKTKTWKLLCFLPGIKSELGYYQSEAAAKEKADTVFKYWLNKMDFLIK